MVGKGEQPKSSRIFHQCYVKCCKLQNLTPLNNVLPIANGKVLDFCVDRIKYTDWPPILNALSCDLSLHTVAIRCRQQVKTVLEHIDCERLAKTVNKRSVILTKFMLSNLVEAVSQMLSNTTLLSSLLLEGLPLKIPYLTPICEVLLLNSSIQHIYLPRCLVGDAGCLALCKAVRCLPNVLTLDLTGCELTPLGAGYLADLIKYQKIHRYSENWVHTLRYRLPELDTMAGLRRITLCSNGALGDAGAARLLEVLADDLWIKALDLQGCGLTDDSAVNSLQTLNSNTTMVVLDLRMNDVNAELLGKVRTALRQNEQGCVGLHERGPVDRQNVSQYIWLGSSRSSSEGRMKPPRNVILAKVVDRTAPANVVRTVQTTKYVNNKTATNKKEREYTEILEEQLQEEISHRQQLEELNVQLVEQMKQLKQHQLRLWATGPASSGSEQSFQTSSCSGELSASSGSVSSVPIDQHTLAYIQQAFRDIYCFIKNNQCSGQCQDEETHSPKLQELPTSPLHPSTIEELSEAEFSESESRMNMLAKKALSAVTTAADAVKVKKTTRSAHALQDKPAPDVKPAMFEKQIGDTQQSYAIDQLLLEEMVGARYKSMPQSSIEDKWSSRSEAISSSSSTLVCASAEGSARAASPRPPPRAASPRPPPRAASPRPAPRADAPNPRDALGSSSDDDEP